MNERLSAFTGSIPQNYDSGLRPIFVDYADDLVARVLRAEPKDVLELAAGTGIVTRRLRDALPDHVNLIASDLNGPMLEVLGRKFKDGERISLREIDATDLPFDGASFDVIACQFGVMFFPDRPQSYREAHRALRPGGRYLFNVWNSLADNPFAAVADETATRFFEHDPPQFYKLPFSYHDVPGIEQTLRDAGFDAVTHEVLTFRTPLPSLGAFAAALVHGNPTGQEVLDRGGDPDEVIGALATAFKQAFGDPATLELSATVFEARKA